jgi:hypothetical protein
MHPLKGGSICDGGHGSNPAFSTAMQSSPGQVDMKAEIISPLILRRGGKRFQRLRNA